MGSKCEDLQNKPKAHGHFGFPLANPQCDQSKDFVPDDKIEGREHLQTALSYSL
jgi:hypothetical protein